MMSFLLSALLGCRWLVAPSCPEGMVLIPAGLVALGVEDPRPWQQSSRMVRLDAFCVDIYEFPNQAGAPPQAQLDWQQALDACTTIGKRLCTSDEWERACRGTTGRLYSYGNTRDPEACNTPIEGSGPGHGTQPYTASGAWPRCKTPEGVYDLNGSLSEWVSDPWDGDPEPFNREARVDRETWRTLRGGTMWSQTFYGQDCTSRHGHHTSFHNIDDGFRCCKTAD